jgi:eukaryotic-like serine/threonine-protein kinase
LPPVARALPLPPDTLLGTIVGDRYRLTARIGDGGMGTVYRAEHVYMRKTVAVKLLHPELDQIDEISKRFTREAETCSRMAHQNIVQVTDFGRMWDGRLFLVMEFVPGESLAALLARKKCLSQERSLNVTLQILNALDHAHGHGVVHRDLKPENIMLVARSGQPDLVKVLDFGIAKISNPSGSAANLTQAGTVFGTPEYMSPEQALGGTAGPQSDLYACGVLLYQMIAGERPFGAPDPVQVLKLQVLEDALPLRTAAPDPLRAPSIDAAVERALQKEPAKRFASAAEMAAALTSASSAVGVAPSNRVSRASRQPWIEQAFGRVVRLHRGTITRLLPRLRRLWTTRLFPGLRQASPRALSPRARKGLLLAAGAALALIVAAIVFPREHVPMSTLAPATATITDADVVRSVEDEMRQGRTPAARALVSSGLARNARSAHLQLLSGSIEFLEQHIEEGLRSYRTALQLDPSLGSDSTLLANTAGAARDERFGTLAFQVLEQAGTHACTTLAELSSSEHGAPRRAARRTCRQLACDSWCATSHASAGSSSRPRPRQGTGAPCSRARIPSVPGRSLAAPPAGTIYKHHSCRSRG